MELILLRVIDLSGVSMELICELNGFVGDVMGGCFLENGDIVLVNCGFKELLYYRNYEIVWKVNLDDMELWDLV